MAMFQHGCRAVTLAAGRLHSPSGPRRAKMDYQSFVVNSLCHDIPDDTLHRSYAPEIQQIKKAMKKRIEAAMDRGASSYDELYSAAYSTPGYDNLRRHLMKLSRSEKKGATGFYSGKPEDELMNLPGQLVDMYQKHSSDYY